jgi:hypothetical protein
MDEDLGNELIESARNGKIENLLEILNKDANIVNYATDEVVLIFIYHNILKFYILIRYYIISMYLIRSMVKQLFIGQQIKVTHQRYPFL